MEGDVAAAEQAQRHVVGQLRLGSVILHERHHRVPDTHRAQDRHRRQDVLVLKHSINVCRWWGWLLSYQASVGGVS